MASIHEGRLQKLGLVLITNRLICGENHTGIIKEAVRGGVGTVQVREKDISTGDLFNLAYKLRKITKDLNASLIINDRVDIAMAVDADGVHLGWQSLEIGVTRKIVGSNKLIGFSAHNLQEAEKANAEGADYITISPIFDTPNKDHYIPPLGTSKIGEIKKHLKVPIIALGGINENNIKGVMENGADGVAVISAILLSKDPKLTAGKLSNVIKNNYSN